MTGVLVGDPAFAWSEQRNVDFVAEPEGMILLSDQPTAAGAVLKRAGEKLRRVAGGSASLLVRVLSPSSTLTEKEQKHVEFLERIATNNVVSPELATRARRVWWAVRAASRKKAPVPISTANTGGPVTYTWRSERHEVAVEVTRTGPCEWFHIDRITEAVTGGESPAESLATDPTFISKLRLVLNQ